MTDVIDATTKPGTPKTVVVLTTRRDRSLLVGRGILRGLGLAMVLGAVGAAIWWPITLHDTSGRYYATQVSCGSLWVDHWTLADAEVAAAGDLRAGADTTHLDRPNCQTARKAMTASLGWPAGVGIVVLAVSFIPGRRRAEVTPGKPTQLTAELSSLLSPRRAEEPSHRPVDEDGNTGGEPFKPGGLGEPATPAVDDKYLFPASAVPPRSATPMRVVTPIKSNYGLTALHVIGGCLLVGGFITMVVGMNRVRPQGNIFSDSAVDTITSALQFSSTNLLIELFGAVAFLIGAMALIGALTVAAVRD